MKISRQAETRFVTPDGRKIALVWQKNEYRAFENRSGRLIDMKLGSVSADNLKDYIMKGGEC